MSSSSLFEQCLSALKRNDEKSLLLSYDGLSSTISSRTRSTPDLKRLVQWFPTWGPQTIFGGPPKLRGPTGVRAKGTRSAEGNYFFGK